MHVAIAIEHVIAVYIIKNYNFSLSIVAKRHVALWHLASYYT